MPTRYVYTDGGRDRERERERERYHDYDRHDSARARRRASTTYYTPPEPAETTAYYTATQPTTHYESFYSPGGSSRDQEPFYESYDFHLREGERLVREGDQLYIVEDIRPSTTSRSSRRREDSHRSTRDTRRTSARTESSTPRRPGRSSTSRTSRSTANHQYDYDYGHTGENIQLHRDRTECFEDADGGRRAIFQRETITLEPRVMGGGEKLDRLLENLTLKEFEYVPPRES